MKTLDLTSFNEFVLTNEEMINVRGGYGAVSTSQDGPGKPPVVVIIEI
jgi:hypothetical protein